MEPIVPQQPDNAAPVSKRRHHVALVILAAVFGILYLAFNVWIYFYAKGKAPLPAVVRRVLNTPEERRSSPASQATITPTEQAPTSPAPTPTPIPTPTPTPRPTGPGEYACAPDGTCNRYGEDARKQYCTVTFADSLCLDQCGDVSKRCKK